MYISHVAQVSDIFVIDDNVVRVGYMVGTGYMEDWCWLHGGCWLSTVHSCSLLSLSLSTSCCVDEVAAEHSSADCIIHFGPSCLTRLVD